ncbi:hypothetical protein R1flu_018191 [Riccia fluitans]|uniref:TMEM205-like domain-containing protein n=1 Tax=Riccia fluitans TaxID=41844 RepID=A0ABD1ZF49_9MARC
MVSNREAKMMNIMAMWMLLPCLVTAMVLSGVETSHPLKAAQEASKQSVEYAADAARKTGEGIRQTVSSGVQSTGEFANSAMGAVKDTSQAGLEKIGLATPEKSTFEQWEEGLQAAKEKATAATSKGARDTGADTSTFDLSKLSAREKFENLRKYGQIVPPSTADIIRTKAADTYDATKDTAADAARKTGEGIRQTVSAGVQLTGEFANSAMDAVKDTSQAGLEKIGLATPEKSTLEQWEDGLQAAKEKATAATARGARDRADDTSNFDLSKLSAREKFENLRKYGQVEPPSTADIIKTKAADTYDATKDTADRAADAAKDTLTGARETIRKGAQNSARAAEAFKDTLAGAGEKMQDGAQYTYRSAEEAAAAAKEKLQSAAGSLKKGSEDSVRYGSEKSSDTADFVSDLAARIANSVQENVNAAGSKAYDTAGSAKDATVDTMGTAYEYAADALKQASGQTDGFSRRSEESDQSYAEALRLATLQAAEILRRRGSQVYDTAGSTKDAAYESAANALKKTREQSKTGYENAVDALERTGGLVTGEEADERYTDKLKKATEHGAEVIKKRGEDAMKYMPNVGQGLSMGEELGGDLQREASEQVEPGGQITGDYGQKAKETIVGGGEDRRASWRKVFLDQVGIREEEDLSRYDVVIGNVKGYWKGDYWQAPGIYRKAGEAVTGAAVGTQEAATSMKNKLSESMHNIGDRIRDLREKGSGLVHETVETTKGKARQGVEDSGDSISRMEGKLNDTVLPEVKEGVCKENPLVSTVKWLGYTVVAWLLSSVKAAHLLSFCSTYGSSVWVTFISGYLLSKSLGRQQYGFVQSRMVPTYLRLIAVGQALCLLLYMALRPWNHASRTEKLQHFNLWGILVSTLVNLFFIEPRATKTLFEKLKLEKEEGSRVEEEAAKRGSDLRAPASSTESPVEQHSEEVKQKFGLLHGVSSILNLLGLMGETWHLWYISRILAL